MVQTAAHGVATSLGAPPIISSGQIAEDVQRTLHELAERVAEYNLRRRELEKRANDIRATLLDRRAAAILGLAEAVGANGKPMYSNVESREAALTLTLKDDTNVQALETERRVVQDEYDRIAVEYSLLKDRLNIAMAAAGVAQPVIESNYATLFAATN